MKPQIFFFLFSFLLIGQVNSIQAQTSEPEVTAEQKEVFQGKLQAFAQELNLSEKQKSIFVNIHQNYFSELNTLKSSDLSKMSKYKKYKSIQGSRKDSMKQVLSKNQYKKYKKGWDNLEKQLKELRKA